MGREAICTAAGLPTMKSRLPTRNSDVPTGLNVAMRNTFVITAVLLASVASAAPIPDTSTYTLYRNSMTDTAMRLHVASFNTAEGTAYNRENCALAQQLFQHQPSVKTRFWCEPGNFRPTPPGQEPTLSKQFTTGKTEPITCSPSAAELARPGSGKRTPSDYRCPNETSR